MRQISLKKQILPGLLLLCALLLFTGRFVQAEEEENSSGEGGIYNLLLVGLDLREDESWNGNSDVVILITVNDNTQKIIMTSFMRDLYADIPGYGGHKLNYAYAVGGASTLIATLEDNYDLEIDNYAAVDFVEMAEIIDLIGGVDIEVREDEVSLVNGYLESMGQYDDYLYSSGYCHLDGYQAVAYMRIRFVGNDDYERTERQRSVLTDIFVELGDMNIAELTILADQVLELSENDITELDLVSLLSSLTNVMDYTLVENRIPYDDLYTSQDGNLVPDFSATTERLHETLYD